MSHGWQSEATDGTTGGWGLFSFSHFLSLSLTIYLPTYLSIYIYLSVCLSIYLPTYLSIYLIHPIYLSNYLSIFLSIYLILSIYLSIYLSTYLSIYLSPSLSLCPSIYLPIDLSIYRSIYLSIYLSTYLSINQPIYLSIHPSIYPSIHPSIYLSISLSVCLSIYLSASLKTKLFCQTSSVLDNIKTAAIQRDVLNFCTWNIKNEENLRDFLFLFKLRTSKTKQFCEMSFKNGKLSAELTASYQCVLRLFQSICLNYCACHDTVMPGHTKCCTCHAKSSQQTWKFEAPKCNLSQEISARTS